MKIRHILLLSTCLFLLTSCQSSPVENENSTYEYTHFTLHGQSASKSEADIINDELEKHYMRILDDMGLTSINRVHLYIFNDGSSLRDAVAKRYPGIYLPGFATGLTPSATDIYLVKPPSGRFTIYIHEFAHCVEQHVNPSIPNRPRWLWESIALFEAGEFTEPSNISVLTSNNLPRLSDMSDFNNTVVYQIGYLLGEYVFKNFGKEKYIELIKSNGNVGSVLGLTDNAFMNEWYKYLKQHYDF